MLKLLAFLWKYKFFLLFLLLEALAFTMLISQTYYQRTVFTSSTNQFTGSIFSTVNSISDYFNLRKINDKLARENAMLRAHVSSSFLTADTNMFFIDDTLYKQQYRYISAKVIANTTSKRNNYLMLNKGRKDGIKKDMAVIAADGVVGIVNEVSANFCSVMSLLHGKSHISAKIKKNNQLGTLAWENNSPVFAYLKEVPTHVILKKGDTIVTSGFSNLFPEGIMIGTISGHYVNPGDNFYTIKIRLSTDFNAIGYVMVVKSLLKKEQTQLEELSKDKDE
ncbi:MAG: rod shape-determining protein MreC [Lentimicrobiaceae bacterium]|nr:rod shape-determining protein MreC [Lentimicrobiaceae bacterium]